MIDAAPTTTVPIAADLLQRLKPDPHRLGPDRWRVVDGDVPVWALIQHLIAIGDLDDPLHASPHVIAQTANDYRIPEIGVHTALAYYREHKGAIDTILATSAGTPPNLTSPYYPDLDLTELVKPDPHHPGPDTWRLVPSQRPIWALIMHIYTLDDIDDVFRVSDATIAQTAADYNITEEEVRAALAYYAANPAAIDTILATNTDLVLRQRGS